LANKNAFTLVELILTIGIMMTIIATASVFTSRWYLQNNLEASKNMLISSFQKAQGYAIFKKNNLTWGVCLTGNTIRMFGGTCASPIIKEDYSLPNNVSISGLSTVTFSSFRGEPNTSQNINLTGNNQTFNLIMNMAGGLIVN
jgi:Tfp pilus assembly protein FimT